MAKTKTCLEKNHLLSSLDHIKINKERKKKKKETEKRNTYLTFKKQYI